MGSIKRFNLKKLARQTDATYFFETGTWKGDGLAYAAAFPFRRLYSSEIIPSIARDAEERFKHDPRITIIVDSSTHALESHLDKINGNCIFWLDAHFPGAEEGLNDYNEFEDETVKLPLERELEIISSRKNKFNDVILIDDLRIYEEGNYMSGNLPPNIITPKNRNTRFAANLFGDTHDILKYFQEEGYLVLLPKNRTPLPAMTGFLFAAGNLLNKKIL